MRHLFSLLVVQCCVLFSYAGDIAQVYGPDKKLQVTVLLTANNQPYYKVVYNGSTMLEPSPLGLQCTTGSFAEQLTPAGTKRRTISEKYQLNRSKVSKVSYKANELVCSFTNSAGDTLEVVFRVSNQDIAFAYRVLPVATAASSLVIEKEFTGFDLPAGTTTFITPQALPGSGWKKTKPSYEEVYTLDEPVGTPSLYKAGYTFPSLFHLNNGKSWVLLSETGISGNYPGTHLSEGSVEGVYTILFPQAGENNGNGPVTATTGYGQFTSWKTITVADNLQSIVTSTVATDVVKPVVQSDKQFTPGRASWSWLLWQDSSCNYNDQVTFIDLAAKLNCEYILIDALWDVQIGRDKTEQLVRYAASKNVGVLLWYNSNGNWNEAPQTPKDRMHNAQVRQTEMEWLQRIGVKGLKIDFFGGDKQETMKLYHDILVDAAAYGLVINFHGATLPRGWERMYPNYVTSEAALASENLIFSQAFCDDYARTATIYPFTRNVVASMDFGPVLLNNRLSRWPQKGNVRRTSDAFEIATSVLFSSAVQHWGITPENLKDKPAYLFDFIKAVPTTWDETRLIDGYPGKYCVLARRKGNRWYVAGVNGEKSSRTLNVSLPMLKGKKVSVIRDGTAGASVLESISSSKSFTITLQSGGGFVIF